jgi:hypothetical protein
MKIIAGIGAFLFFGEVIYWSKIFGFVLIGCSLIISVAEKVGLTEAVTVFGKNNDYSCCCHYHKECADDGSSEHMSPSPPVSLLSKAKAIASARIPISPMMMSAYQPLAMSTDINQSTLIGSGDYEFVVNRVDNTGKTTKKIVGKLQGDHAYTHNDDDDVINEV